MTKPPKKPTKPKAAPPPLTNTTPTEAELEASYKAMAADKEREAEAHEWCEAFIGDQPWDDSEAVVT